MVSQMVPLGESFGNWGDRLWRTARVCVISAEIIEGYLDFFLAYLVALVEDVSEVSLATSIGVWYPVLAHLVYCPPCPP